MKAFLILLSLAFLSSCSTETTQDIENNTVPASTTVTLDEYAKKESIRVLDTDFSKGRLQNTQEITLWDIQKLHGHLCDGLVVGFFGLKEALYVLYPDSVIDRTNTRIVAQSSPCIGDVGMYLSGGRYQFNSFYVDNRITGLYVVQRINNGRAVTVTLLDGIKPKEISELGALAVKNELSSCGLDSLKRIEEEFSLFLFKNSATDIFMIHELSDFKWNPLLKNDFSKTDILNKNKENCEHN